MTIEMGALFTTMVLGLVHLTLASFAYKAQVGNARTVGPRDDDPPRLKLAGRLDRAQRNFLETFPIFATAVLMLHSLGRTGGWLGESGALIYVAGRMLYLPLYALGIPWLRSFAWKFATLGLVLVMVAALV